VQSEADCIHLWFGRRAMVRVRSQLMAAIYDKSLKRKDFSGITKKGGTKPVGDKEEAIANDPKSSADVGKIVNMMASDTNQV
jgi:hypothetical protein